MSSSKKLIVIMTMILLLTSFVAIITMNYQVEKSQYITTRVQSNNSKLSETNSVIPKTGDYYNITLNDTTTSIYYIYSIVFLNDIDSQNINSSIVVQTQLYNGSKSTIVNGTFEMNVNTYHIANDTGIDNWKNTTLEFMISTGIPVGTHLQIGSDTNATIIGQTTYTLNNKVFNVLNVTYNDFGTPVFAYYEVNTGVLLYYQSINMTVGYGSVTATSFLDLFQISNTSTQSNTGTSVSSSGSTTSTQSNTNTNSTLQSSSTKSTLTTTAGFDYQTLFIMISLVGIFVLHRKRKK